MFTTESREAVRRRLLDLAREDPLVGAAAVIGSGADGSADEWSDIDLSFGILEAVPEALERWTRRLGEEFAVVHSFDLPFGATVYRVFLLPDGLEIDLSFTPLSEFAPRGPSWRTVFGQARPGHPVARPPVGHLAGLAWHHVLHANAALERGRLWEAEYWTSALRDQVIALASVRADVAAAYAKGAHRLPAETLQPLEASLVRSLGGPEIRRALRVAAMAFDAELARADAGLASRLRPVLLEFAGPMPPS